jgi:hypothetical protein
MAEQSNSRIFPLRIPPSLHIDLERLAEREGISLNQAILVAITERVARSEGGGRSAIKDTSQSQPSATVGVVKKNAT